MECREAQRRDAGRAKELEVFPSTKLNVSETAHGTVANRRAEVASCDAVRAVDFTHRFRYAVPLRSTDGSTNLNRKRLPVPRNRGLGRPMYRQLRTAADPASWEEYTPPSRPGANRSLSDPRKPKLTWPTEIHSEYLEGHEAYEQNRPWMSKPVLDETIGKLAVPAGFKAAVLNILLPYKLRWEAEIIEREEVLAAADSSHFSNTILLPKIEKADRRLSIDAYIAECRAKGIKITRTDIWKYAGYETSADFLRWQRGDDLCSKTADQNFTRILREKPHLK